MSQLELFDELIRVKLVSSNGHQSFNIPLCGTNEFLLKQAKKLGLWLYVDGVQSDHNSIDIDTLHLLQKLF